MEFQVLPPETGSVLTESAPSQAGLQAREEYAKMLSDPKHPHYEGLRRRDPKAEAYANGLYDKAYPKTAPTKSGDDVSGTPSERDPAGLSEAEREAAEDARELADLQADWGRDGDSYEAGLQEAREMAMILHTADPTLYLEAARRLGDAMGLRLLRLLRQRVNL
ncbi:MAG: hypothetical protein L0Z46_02740 [Nitrospiraceae bacterium]|nr:hypothetical protein [Nitrospiraceae bacterium]